FGLLNCGWPGHCFGGESASGHVGAIISAACSDAPLVCGLVPLDNYGCSTNRGSLMALENCWNSLSIKLSITNGDDLVFLCYLVCLSYFRRCIDGSSPYSTSYYVSRGANRWQASECSAKGRVH